MSLNITDIEICSVLEVIVSRRLFNPLPRILNMAAG